jgi:hypothetical protein
MRPERDASGRSLGSSTDGGAFDAAVAEPFDPSAFGLTEMLRCGLALRVAARGAPTMESAAQGIVRYLYDAARDPRTGQPACPLVRCFVSLPIEKIGLALQQSARRALGDESPAPGTRCLTLLATMGDESAWRSRHTSRAHKTIPLASEAMVKGAPMIAELIHAFGFTLDSIIAPRSRPTMLNGPTVKTYNVFHVEEAVGSPFIPAQEEFVLRHGIRSVLGFGGALSSGEIVAAILFSRVPIPAASATRFRNIALDLKAALYGYSLDQVFDARPTS